MKAKNTQSAKVSNVVTFDKANGNGQAYGINPNLWVTNFKELVDAIKAEFQCVVYGAKGLDGNFYGIAINTNRATLAEFTALVNKVAKFGEKPVKERKIKEIKDKATAVALKKAVAQDLELALIKEQLAQLIASMTKK